MTLMNFELEGDALDAYNRMAGELKAKAMSELGLPESEIIVRPLRAEDVGFTTPQWASPAIADATTNAWNNIINTYTIADNRFVGINGVHRGFGQGTTNAFSQVRITKSGKMARIWNLQAVEDFVGNTVYFDDYVTVDQNNQLTIEGYALVGTTDKMVLLGLVAEKRGQAINP